MAFCHECGSEVATNDTFCPYCGIAIQNSAEQLSPETDLDPDSAEQKELSEHTQTADAETVQAETAQKTPENQSGDFSLRQTEEDYEIPFTDISVQKDLSSNNPAIGSEETSASKNEVPEKFESEFAGNDDQTLEDNFNPTYPTNPDHLSSENSLVGNLSSENTAAESKVETVSQNELPANDGLLNDKLKSELSFDNPLHDSSPENLENSSEPAKDSINEAESADQNDELSFDFKPDAQPEQNVANAELDETPATVETNSESVPESEKQMTVEPQITKPSDNLESHISEPPASQFDSVRIMEHSAFAGMSVEPKSSSAESSIIFPEQDDENASNNLKSAPEIESVQEIPAAVSSSVPVENAVAAPVSETAHSSTTPNFGGDSDNKKAKKLKPLDEGTVLNNRYEIIRKIGGGGMGAVYLASDNNLGGVLRAVKEMVQSYIEEEQQDKAINDFKRESMILSTLDHPSIPTIYDYFFDEIESRFYLVMKYINGGDLSLKLRSTPAGKIDEKTVTEWGIQIADTLDYLHNRPTTIVYRDLKPANVMIDGNSGRVMLIDFGIARSVNKEEKGVTAVGTMGYAPPELFSGNVEPRSDIYSLGSTMFHLLTGADPQSNPLLIFDFQKNPRPRQINSQLSDQMERILMRSVEYNAVARFDTAGELRKTLQEHLENLKNNRVSYGVKEAPQPVSLENQPVFCGFCGQRIMATDMFCAFCGARQPLSQKGVHSEIYSHSAPTARFMVIGTNELDAPVYNIEKELNLIGRRDPMSNIFPEVDLSKYDPQTKVSRRHALVKMNAGNYTVEDLGSSNGTLIIKSNDNQLRLLPHQPQALTDGDKIRVGDTILSFLLR